MRRVGIFHCKFSDAHPFQVDEFGQYKWAYRHPKDGWRERYRKNRDRMDMRIAQIVEENPPPPDGKGRYKYRRYRKIDEDDELNADDDGFDEMDEEERRDSATDNEDSPVQIKRANAQRQEEEEQDDDDVRQAVMHQPEASSNLRSRDAERREEEIAEEQAGEQQPEAGRTRSTRQSQVSLGDALGPKRRRTVSSPSTSLPRLLSDSLALNRRLRSAHHRLLWRSLGSLMISMRHYEVIPGLTTTSPLKNLFLPPHPLTRRKSGTARRSGRRLEHGEWCPRFHPAERALACARYQFNLKLSLLLRALPQGQKQKQKLPPLPPQRRSPLPIPKFLTSLYRTRMMMMRAKCMKSRLNCKSLPILEVRH